MIEGRGSLISRFRCEQHPNLDLIRVNIAQQDLRPVNESWATKERNSCDPYCTGWLTFTRNVGDLPCSQIATFYNARNNDAPVFKHEQVFDD